MIQVDIIDQNNILGESNGVNWARSYEHNDISFNPKPYAKFHPADTDDIESWEDSKLDYFMDHTLNNDPENDFYLDDAGSHVAWVYVADYTTHIYSTAGAKTYYIHARINQNNELEFGIFNNKVNNKHAKTNNLFELNASKDNISRLTIASKEESEKHILNSAKDKIKISSLAKCAGYMINREQFIVSDGEAENTNFCTVYGHIWTYWYVIDNNKLYFCGFPLYTGNDKGKISVGDTFETRNIPPTVYDVLTPGTAFYNAWEAVHSEDESNPGGAKRILNEYGDTEETTNITIVLNEIDNKPHHWESSNVSSDIRAFSENGGVYRIRNQASTRSNNSNQLAIGGIYDINIYKNDDCDIHGNSGYACIPIKGVDTTVSDGAVTYEYFDKGYALTNFSVLMNKNSYAITVNEPDRLLDGDPTPVEPIITEPGLGGGGWGGGGGGTNRRKERKKKKRQVSYYVIDCGNIGTEWRSLPMEETAYNTSLKRPSTRDFFTLIINSDFDTTIGDTSVFTRDRKEYTASETQTVLKRTSQPCVAFNPNSTSGKFPYSLWGSTFLNYGKLVDLSNSYQDYMYFNSKGLHTHVMRYGLRFSDFQSSVTNEVYFAYDGWEDVASLSGQPTVLRPNNNGLQSANGNFKLDEDNNLLTREKSMFTLLPAASSLENLFIKPVPSAEGGSSWVDTPTENNLITLSHSMFKLERRWGPTSGHYYINVPGVPVRVQIRYEIFINEVSYRTKVIKNILDRILYNFKAGNNPIKVKEGLNDSELYSKDVNTTYQSKIKQDLANTIPQNQIVESVLDPPSITIESTKLAEIDELYYDSNCTQPVLLGQLRFFGTPQLQACMRVRSNVVSNLSNNMARIEIPFFAERDKWWEAPTPETIPPAPVEPHGRFYITFEDDPKIISHGNKIVIESNITTDTVEREIYLKSS